MKVNVNEEQTRPEEEAIRLDIRWARVQIRSNDLVEVQCHGYNYSMLFTFWTNFCKKYSDFHNTALGPKLIFIDSWVTMSLKMPVIGKPACLPSTAFNSSNSVHFYHTIISVSFTLTALSLSNVTEGFTKPPSLYMCHYLITSTLLWFDIVSTSLSHFSIYAAQNYV